jgi:hypothetical protein
MAFSFSDRSKRTRVPLNTHTHTHTQTEHAFDSEDSLNAGDEFFAAPIDSHSRSQRMEEAFRHAINVMLDKEEPREAEDTLNAACLYAQCTATTGKGYLKKLTCTMGPFVIHSATGKNDKKPIYVIERRK